VHEIQTDFKFVRILAPTGRKEGAPEMLINSGMKS